MTQAEGNSISKLAPIVMEMEMEWKVMGKKSCQVPNDEKPKVLLTTSKGTVRCK